MNIETLVPDFRYVAGRVLGERPNLIYEFGLGDRLRAARENAGFGQEQFAEVAGISRGSVSNYERGITRPRRPVLLAWANATGFDRHWLETGEEPASEDGISREE